MKSFDELPDYPELRKLWKQKPLDPPKSEHELELTPDSGVERGAEVIGWSLARLEYWLSESGWLRAWLRINLIVSIVLTSAGVLLLPPVAQVLEQMAMSSHWLAAIIADLFGVLTGLPPVAISLGVVYLAFVAFRWFRRRQRRQQQQQPRGFPQDDYYQ